MVIKNEFEKAGIELLPARMGFFVRDTAKARTILRIFCEENGFEYLARTLRTQKALDEMCLRTEKVDGEPLIWVLM